MNELRLLAEIVERDAVRYTPAGVPVVEFKLAHGSDTQESGVVRRIEFEIAAIAVGDASRWIAGAPMSVPMQFTGFVAKRSVNARTLVYHVTALDASSRSPSEYRKS